MRVLSIGISLGFVLPRCGLRRLKRRIHPIEAVDEHRIHKGAAGQLGCAVAERPVRVVKRRFPMKFSMAAPKKQTVGLLETKDL